MNKNLLSAFLFGAAVLASTSTFVSCKDYDDDIKNLQTEIDANKASLEQLVAQKEAALQAQLDALKAAQEKCESDCAAAREALKTSLEGKVQEEKDRAIAAEAALNAADQNLQNAINAVQAALDANVATLQQKDLELSNAIVAANAAIDQINSDLGTAINNIDVLFQENNTRVGEIRDLQSSLTEVKENLQGQIDLLGTKYEDVLAKATANEAELVSVNAKIETINGDIDFLSQENIARRDDITALQTKSEQLLDSIRDDRADIQQLYLNGLRYMELITALQNEDAIDDAKIDSIANELGYAQDDIQNLYSERDRIEAAVTQLQNDMVSCDTKIDSIDAVYAAACEQINSDLDFLGQENLARKDEITQLQSQVVELNEYLEACMNNLITNIIYEAKDDVIAYYNQVAADVTFPAAGVEGAIIVKAGQYLVQQNGGNLYATINPAEVNFEDNVKFKLVNSVNAEHPVFTLGDAKKTNTILVAKAQKDNNGNGFYEIPVKSEGISDDNPRVTYGPASNDVLYAIQTAYTTTGSKTVTSNYGIKVVPTAKAAVAAVDMEPASSNGSFVTGKSYTIEFKGASTDTEISGELKPTGIKNNEVYAIYYEVENKAFITEKPSGVIAGDKVEEAITLTVNEDGINQPFDVTIKALNYDGTVTSATRKVCFTRSILGAITVEMTVTPLSKNPQTIAGLNDSIKAELGADKTAKYVANATAITGVAGLENITPAASITGLNIAADLTSGDLTWDPTKYSATNTKFTAKQVVNNADGNEVVTINFVVNVLKPTYLNDQFKHRIASAFGVIDEEENLTVAWARNCDITGDNMTYTWNGRSFNLAPITAAHDAYVAANGADETTLAFASTDTNISFTNNWAASTVTTDKKYIYVYAPGKNTAAGAVSKKFPVTEEIHYFGLPAFNYVGDTFEYRVVSEVNYGISKNPSINLGNVEINNVGDAAKALPQNQWTDYSNNQAKFDLRDSRIVTVDAEVVPDAANNYALVNTVSYDKITNSLKLNINAGAATGEAPLTFKLTITDKYGIQTEIPLTLTIKASGATAKARK